MNGFYICLGLIASLCAAEATFVIGAPVVAGTLFTASGAAVPATVGISAMAASTLIGLKALLVGGILIGGLLARRGKRSLNEVEYSSASDVFLAASLKDVDDCAKMLVCRLNAMPVHKLKEEEITIARTFGAVPSIDVTRSTVEFDVAAHMGRLAGAKQCETMYHRCQATNLDMMAAIRKAAAEI